MLKKFPIFRTDAELERFVETADLSEYDLSQFKRVNFEIVPKKAQLNMRVPQPLLDAVKERAKARGIPYARFVREAMEAALAQPAPKSRRKAGAAR